MAQIIPLEPRQAAPEPRRGIRHTSAGYRPYDSAGGGLQQFSGLNRMADARKAQLPSAARNFRERPRRPDGGGDDAA